MQARLWPSTTSEPRRSIFLFALAASAFVSLLHAQNAPAPDGNAPASDQQDASTTLSPDALNTLLGPIALYPDALIALILPASTVPSDITLADRYLQGNGNPDDAANQSWDPSVKSLVRYPDVVKWMDDNLDWTTSLGEAFVAQPADVMNAIQGLRAQAKAAGTLTDTPQQNVVTDDSGGSSYISIVPAQPDTIYVPSYDPQVVYTAQPANYATPVIAFGAGLAVGAWLNYGVNWGHHGVYYGDYQPGWGHGYNNGGGNVTNITTNNVNVTNINTSTARAWQPTPAARRQLDARRPAYVHRVQAANAEVARQPAHPGVPRHLTTLPQPTHPAANHRVTSETRPPAASAPGGYGAANAARHHGHANMPATAAPNLAPNSAPNPGAQDYKPLNLHQTREATAPAAPGTPKHPHAPKHPAAEAAPGQPAGNPATSEVRPHAPKHPAAAAPQDRAPDQAPANPAPSADRPHVNKHPAAEPGAAPAAHETHPHPSQAPSGAAHPAAAAAHPAAADAKKKHDKKNDGQPSN